MTYLATPQDKNPCHEIFNIGKPFLVIIFIHLVCLNHAKE